MHTIPTSKILVKALIPIPTCWCSVLSWTRRWWSIFLTRPSVKFHVFWCLFKLVFVCQEFNINSRQRNNFLGDCFLVLTDSDAMKLSEAEPCQLSVLGRCAVSFPSWLTWLAAGVNSVVLELKRNHCFDRRHYSFSALKAKGFPSMAEQSPTLQAMMGASQSRDQTHTVMTSKQTGGVLLCSQAGDWTRWMQTPKHETGLES